MSMKHYSTVIVSSLLLTATVTSSAFASTPKEPTWFKSKGAKCREIIEGKAPGIEYEKAPVTKVGVTGSYGGASGGFDVEIQPAGRNKSIDPGLGNCCLYNQDGGILHAVRTHSGNTGCGDAAKELLRQRKGDGEIVNVPVQTFIQYAVKTKSGQNRIQTKVADETELAGVTSGKTPKCTTAEQSNCFIKNTVLKNKDGVYIVYWGIDWFAHGTSNTDRDWWYGAEWIDLKNVWSGFKN